MTAQTMTTRKKTLANKVVWLTGGSSGIGLAVLKQLLKAGAQVVVTARNFHNLKQLQAAYPEQLKPLPADLSRAEDIRFIEKELPGLASHLDYVILNAGICEYVDVHNLEVSVFRDMMEVNYFAAIECCRIALPLLRKAQEKPQIIGVSSLSTVLPFTRAQAYGASKSAFSYFLHALRIDIHDAIDVTVVNPGFVKTPLTDRNDFQMPFLQDADQAAAHIMKAMRTRPLHYSFPGVFSGLLSIFSLFPRFWLFVSRKYLLDKTGLQD